MKKDVLQCIPEGDLRMGMNPAWRGKQRPSTIFRDMIDVCKGSGGGGGERKR